MKKLFISAVVMIGGSLAVQAQVKYGDNPATVNPGSLLELESTNKGFMPPRIALTDRLVWGLNGATPANGMIVYNTAAGLNSLDTGLVVWQGKWNQLSTQQTADFWRLNGNTGTIKGANFVGTADNADLVFKTNGQYRMHLDSLGGMWLGDSSLVYNGSVGNTFSGLFSSFYNKDQGALTGPAGSVSGRMAHKLSATSPYLLGSLYGVESRLNVTADNGVNRSSGDAGAAKVVASRGTFNGDADGTGYIEYLSGINLFAGHTASAVGTTNNVYGVKSDVMAAGGTIGNLYGVYTGTNPGTGASVTNQYGVYIDTLATGAANKWALYSPANVPSAHKGIVDIGFDNPAAYSFGHQLNIKGHLVAKRWNMAPNFVQTRYNGTEAAPTAVLKDDQVGAITFEGFAGGGTSGPRPSVADIKVWAAENVTPATSGGSITFNTAPVGTVSPAQRVTILENGNVGIGLPSLISSTRPANPTNTLHVKATANPVRFEGLQNGAATDNIVTVDANGVLTKSAGTLSAADLTNDAWVNNAANTRIELGTNADGTTARTAGNEFVALDNGNVGIGLTAPSAKLEIADNTGTNDANPVVLISASGANNRAIATIQSFQSPQTTPNYIFQTNFTDATGATVGPQHNFSQFRGTGTPTSWTHSPLLAGDVLGSIAMIGSNANNNSTNGAHMWAYTPDGTKTILSLGTRNLTTNGGGRSQALNIVSNGTGGLEANIGINTTTPTNKLHVVATANPVRFEGLQPAAATDNIVTVDANGVLTKTATSLSAADLTSDAWVNNAANARVELSTQSDGTTARTAGTEFVALDNGKVGIGTNVPTANLHIADATGMALFPTLNGSGLSINLSSATLNTSLDPNSSYGETVRLSVDNTYTKQNLQAGNASAESAAGSTLNLNRIRGLFGQGAHRGSGTVAQLFGGDLSVFNVGTGTATSARGLYTNINNTSTGTITDAYGTFSVIANTGAGTITNAYGNYIGNIAGTNKWSLYATDATAPSYFAGSTGIGTTAGVAPTNKLHVVATTNPVRFEGLQTGAATDNIVTVDANGVLTKTATSLSAADLTNDAWVNNAANARVELGTKSDGTVRAAGTEFVATDNGRVGVGTTTLDFAKLDSRETLTADATGLSGVNYVASNGSLFLNHSAATSNQVYRGLNGSVTTLPANATNYTDRLYGASTSVNHQGGGTVNQTTGFYGATFQRNAASVITTNNGIQAEVRVDAGLSNNIQGVYSYVSTQPSSTIKQPSVVAVRGAIDALGAGMANAYSFSATVSSLTNVDNYYSYFIPASTEAIASTGSKYAFYNNADIKSWFKGSLGIGTAAGTANARLHVVKAAADLTPAIIEGCMDIADGNANGSTNDEALAAGLPSGGIYRTGDVMKVVH